MSSKNKTILMRFARSLGAIVIAATTAFIAGPEGADLVGDQAQTIIVAVGTPLLVAADKWLRYGGDVDDV